MGSFTGRGSQFLYLDDLGEHVIIDFNDFIHNYSRVPFHSPEGHESWPDIILGLMDDSNDSMMLYTMMDALLVSWIVQDAKPKRALIVGDKSCMLGTHVETILSKAHDEASAVKVSATSIDDLPVDGFDYVFVKVGEKFDFEKFWNNMICSINAGGKVCILAESKNQQNRFLEFVKHDLCMIYDLGQQGVLVTVTILGNI